MSSIYRPPKTNFELFNKFIGDAFASESLENCDKIICGDFNLNLMNMTEAANNSSVFHNNMQTLALLPVISKPTRISKSSSSLIDNIFVNNLVNFRSGIFTIDISDHMPIFIIYKQYFDSEKNPPKKISYRIINETTLQNLYNNFSLIDANEIMSKTDVNDALITLHNKILDCYNVSCPIKTKTVSVKDQTKPWINATIKHNILKRQNNYRLYKRNLMSEREYKSFRNLVNNQIRTAKRQYYEKLFWDNKQNIKKTWSIVNSVLHKSSGNNKSDIKSILVNNVTYTDEYEICQQFNDYYSTIGKKVQETIPDTSTDDGFSNYMNESQSTHSFEFSRVSVQEIENAIMSLKSKRSHISTYSDKILKYINNLVSPLLAYIMNRSLASGSFPQFLKIARVIPIFKAGDPNQLGNYRPISILPIFSKNFEKNSFQAAV